MSRDIWNPRQYGAFSDERDRPFYELLGRVGAQDPVRVVDLGCGPGDLTASLAERWPKASIEGIDSSPSMIEKAAPHADGERLRFSVGDLAEWRPAEPVDVAVPVDVILSNAALQWVPGHQRLLPLWIDALSPGGWLAFAVPANFDAPSHTILRELCTSERWNERLAGTIRHDIISEPAEYLSLLADHGCRVDAWETTYLQTLSGDDAVLNWVKGTGLRPVLAALAGAESERFLAEYRARLAEAYPVRSYGTLFPFRRTFVVAQKG
jgi:trans-aconitate 2-methyltransferase